MRLFYSAYLLSKSVNSIFKIFKDCSFLMDDLIYDRMDDLMDDLMDDFENLFLKNYSLTATESVVHILH